MALMQSRCYRHRSCFVVSSRFPPSESFVISCSRVPLVRTWVSPCTSAILQNVSQCTESTLQRGYICLLSAAVSSFIQIGCSTLGHRLQQLLPLQLGSKSRYQQQQPKREPYLPHWLDPGWKQLCLPILQHQHRRYLHIKISAQYTIF